MKKWIAGLLALLFLTGCGGGNMQGDSTFYGKVKGTEDVISTLALSGNQLLYLSMDETEAAAISVLDVRTGKSEEFSPLPDYLARRENIACLDDVLYFSYWTKDAGLKRLAADISQGSTETLGSWKPSTFLGEERSAAGKAAVYTLHRFSNGVSDIDRYEPASYDKISAWVQSADLIRAISVYGDAVYAVVSRKDTDVIVRYSADGEPEEEWPIREFAGSFIREEKLMYFQFMGECFYLESTPGRGYAFQLDGTPIEELTGYSIASDDPSDRAMHIFYCRGTAEPLVIYSHLEQAFSTFQPELPEGFVIVEACTDSNDPARLMLFLRNEETGEEQALLIDTGS